VRYDEQHHDFDSWLDELTEEPAGAARPGHMRVTFVYDPEFGAIAEAVDSEGNRFYGVDAPPAAV
jgi:hypothetical protein